MSIGLLLITHQPLGGDLLRIASAILGTEPAATEALELVNDRPCECMLREALDCVDRLDQGGGVLVLTDLYGATPANIALALHEQRRQVRVISGVNLPMLLRALNYAELDLDSVAEKALEGGREGVIRCQEQDA
ncbi:PTS sugar transporter subunit IIA [Marichromatium sp. AB31]|uniref:PTS sugar transporter subunit IIA n=1 Tax=Marichromatium sp. AB31 TaxID=2483362 RepID=UPI000F40F62A|nr:PTS fructose transporter subunit IIA [Marichromatium sp. AB31]RNE91651.1 PTS fructose transporter subunit IIA [Marichromatium sp. AB31]